MNLKDFKDRINACYDHCKNPEEIEVLITLDTPSMGPRASSGIGSVNIGFDWEANQLRIEPKLRLERKGLTRDNNRPKIYNNKPDSVLNGYWCPRCQQGVDEKDKYCKHCGQKIEGVVNNE